MRFTAVMIAAMSSLLLAVGQSSPEVVPDLGQLRDLIKGNREDRFELIVKFIERAPTDAEASEAMKVFRQGVDILSERTNALGNPMVASSEYDRMRREIWRPMESHMQLLWLDDDIALRMIRTLHRAPKTERVQLLKIMAHEAQSDFKIEDDYVYLGPTCGTYDHTSEHKMEWAAPRYREDCIAALEQPSWSGRSFMMATLGVRTGATLDARLQPIILKLATDQNTLVRGQAILGLSKHPSPKADSLIAEGLRSRAADTRAKAAYAAACRRLATVEDTCIQLVNDPVSDVASAAITYLGSMGTPRCKSKLIGLLKDSEKLWFALAEIKRSECVEASPYIVDMLGKPVGDSHGSLLSALVAIDPNSAVEEVDRALRSNDIDFLCSAIHIAGQMKLPRFRAALERLANHKDKDVKKATAWSLEQLHKG